MAPPAKRRKVDFKRRTGPQIEAIPFNDDDRADFLTGFRKRKQQRIKHAQEENVKKERALKVESRKMLREQRRKDLETHVQTVNAMIKKTQRIHGGDSGSSSDDSESEEEAEVKVDEADLGREDEYVDEEKYTTVTVEPMKLSGDEESSADEEDAAEGDEVKKSDGSRPKRVWTKEKPNKAKPKPKKKKFRYESKVERKATRSKQASKNSAAAKARREASSSGK